MSRKKYIGMDLGHGLARFAMVDPDNNEISNHYTLTWEQGQNELKNQHTVFGKELDKLSSGELILSLPPDAVFTRYIELPSLKEDQLKTAMSTRIRRYFRLNPKVHTLSYAEMTPISGDFKHKGYLAMVINKNVMDEQISLMQSYGLKAAHVDLSHNAFVRWLLKENEDLQKGHYMFVSLRRKEILIGAFIDKNIYFARSLRPSFIETKIWKESKCEDLKGFKPYLEVLAREILAAESFIRFRMFPKEMKPEKIILSGRFCNEQVLAGILGKTVDTPIVPIEPVKFKFTNDIDREDLFKYEIAIGLSLRIMEDSLWA